MRSLFIGDLDFVFIDSQRPTASWRSDQLRCERTACNIRPRAGEPARGFAHSKRNAYKCYCFDPVVLFFGFGEQFRFCGLASFSQAAMLAYLQLSAPLADVLMQNAAFPIVCGACILLPLVEDESGFPIVPCA